MRSFDSDNTATNGNGKHGFNEKNKEGKDVERFDSRNDSVSEGQAKFQRLGWKKLTICLIVEAIALGSLSIPSVFATVGMVAGVILSVSLGLIAIYTSYLVGQVKLKHPEIEHYSDAVGLCWGRFGKELAGVMFVLLLVLLVGGHTLTGTIAWVQIVDNYTICALIWGVLSAIILFALALPPSFAEFAILGYIDFASILLAIGVVIVATGISASKSAGGISGVEWSVWPPPDLTFYKAFLSVTNIIFAYSFAVCQFSFMSEMHTPKDYVKSIWALGLIEIFIYTVTGALGVLIYLIGELRNARSIIYRQTTVVLILPEMNMTGRATPKAILDTVKPVDSSAGLLTSFPAKM